MALSVGDKALSYITKFSRALMIGCATTVITVGCTHSKLSKQEKDPQNSVAIQYDSSNSVDSKSSDLHQLVAQLNQRVSVDPNDALAWELLAQTYYNNGYHAYAVYAASEAIESGYSSAKIKKILLNSSAIVSKSQLEADYLAGETDKAFLAEYQLALSKIYGEVHGFNYDESLPKPPVVRVKAAPQVKSNSRSSARKATPKVKKSAPPKKRVAPKPAKKATPKTAPKPKSSSISKDPFSILRN